MWEVTEAKLNSDELNDLLAEGWEPFSAYSIEWKDEGYTEYQTWVLLRRKKTETT